MYIGYNCTILHSVTSGFYRETEVLTSWIHFPSSSVSDMCFPVLRIGVSQVGGGIQYCMWPDREPHCLHRTVQLILI